MTVNSRDFIGVCNIPVSLWQLNRSPFQRNQLSYFTQAQGSRELVLSHPEQRAGRSHPLARDPAPLGPLGKKQILCVCLILGLMVLVVCTFPAPVWKFVLFHNTSPSPTCTLRQAEVASLLQPSGLVCSCLPRNPGSYSIL